MALYFVTGNAGKFREIQAILPDIEQLDLDLDEIQSLDPQAVIEHKLAQAAARHDGQFIVEDTTLTFRCLGQLPGTYIKHFEKSLGMAGVVDLAQRYDDHSAIGGVTIGYRDKEGQSHYFKGEIDGTIVSPRGDNGFGWDPIFVPDGYQMTFSEMTTDQKSKLSMRALAARKLAAHLQA